MCEVRFRNLRTLFDTSISMETGISIEKIIETRKSIVDQVRQELDEQGYDLTRMCDDCLYLKIIEGQESKNKEANHDA